MSLCVPLSLSSFISLSLSPLLKPVNNSAVSKVLSDLLPTFDLKEHRNFLLISELSRVVNCCIALILRSSRTLGSLVLSLNCMSTCFRKNSAKKPHRAVLWKNSDCLEMSDVFLRVKLSSYGFSKHDRVKF